MYRIHVHVHCTVNDSVGHEICTVHVHVDTCVHVPVHTCIEFK